MDLHTLVSRIQGLDLSVDITANSIPPGFKGAGAKWLTLCPYDYGNKGRYYAVEFVLNDGAPVDTDDVIESKLQAIAHKVKAYDEIDREKAVA